MAHDDGTVGVAEDYLCSHVYQLVDEEQAALEHLLMEEDATAGLCRDDDEHRQEVGRQSGPRCVGQRHDGAVDEGIYLIVVLTRDDEVVALNVYLHAKAAESVGDDAEIAERHVLYAYAVAHHGGHSDERADLNHVGQDVVGRSVKGRDADDGQQV